jgi:N-acetylmuramoyl-L-alanine amidase
VAEAPASTVKRVGIQAGHWKSSELPAELAGLRNSTGTSGGGVPEWRLNLDVAQRVAALLEAEGIEVDVLPATVPPGYQADAFVALHADGDASGRLSGFKLARSRRSAVPEQADALIDAITAEYREATGLRICPHVSRNMTGYYAFSPHRFSHATAPSTPAVILEMGFMTNASDLRFLLNHQDTIARGIADGVLRYLAANQ